MAADKGKVTINGRFPAGTTVKLFGAGSADAFSGNASGKPVTTAKTDRNGETTFEAPPGRYFAVAKVKDWNVVLGETIDQIRSVDVTIHSQHVLDALTPHEQAQREAAAPEPPAPSFLDNAEIVIGARSSADGNATVDRTMLVDKRTGMVSEFASPIGGQPLKKSEIPNDGVAPAPRLEDHRDAELASSTLTGEAVPPQNQPPKQEDAPKGMLQASDTEEGVQVPAREVVRQEDYKGRQASDTETGTAFPVDPNQLTRSASGTGRQVQTGSSKPARATREAKGRSGAANIADKAEAHQQKANESKQARAARKASGGDEPETQRSASDTTATSQPTEDVRGVEHIEVPEQIGSPDEPRASSAKRSGKKRSGAKKAAKRKR